MQITIIDTRTSPTVSVVLNNKTFIFHSKYDPINEAESWVRNLSKTIKVEEDILIIGLGAGYHIEELSKVFPKNKIKIVEFNDDYFSWFMKSNFYKNISRLKNIQIISFARLPKEQQPQIFSSFSSTNIAIHKSTYDIFPDKYLLLLQSLKNLQYHQKTVIQQVDSLYENFQKNILLNDSSICELKNLYKNRPAILVSAGPSLSKQLALLKKAKRNSDLIIGAVGTAIKPLLKEDIIPDFFMISDPKSATLSQITNISLPQTKLFYLSTAYHDTILLHKGERHIIFQKGFPEAEHQAMIKREPTVQTGGSVATSLLDTMICLGIQSVALIGQDLAYTNGLSHTKGAHLQKQMPVTSNQQMVLNYNRDGWVHSSKNLSLYKAWFERYAEEHPHLQLFNCTEGGAYIKLWENIPFEKYISLFQ